VRQNDFWEGTMKLHRRGFLHLAVGATALSTALRSVRAQTYPTRPITMIVPAGPGTGFDTTARIVAERMRGSLKQPIVVENVPGADGNLGTGRAARSRPDGYTIMMGSNSTHVLNAALYSLPYDVLNDFAPISPVVMTPYALFAKRTMQAKDLHELIAWLKANPNKALIGFSLASNHVLSAYFQKETATQFTQVPYRGGGPAVQDLVAGQIDLYFSNLIQLPLVRAGSIKAYAVTSDRRLEIAPDIPTFAELGLPTMSRSGWTGLFAPKGTPKEIISSLNTAVVDALADPAVRSRLVDFADEILPPERWTPEALRALQKSDAEKWWPIIKAANIKAE
jgi:tripartite-type tricarboxylate transporter receptor subunit TctC